MTNSPEIRIKELSLEMLEAKSQRDRLNQDAQKWAERKDNLHREIQKLRLKANDLKEKRDALNSEVQKLKALREEAVAQCHDKVEQLKKLRRDIGKWRTKKPQRSFASLRKEIEEVDWKIQTGSLSLDEEKKMV
ncbi:MAG: hypothetical protein QXG97_07325, partial [Nitrososphaerota archaeon]